MPDNLAAWLVFVSVTIALGLLINILTPDFNVWSLLNRSVLPRLKTWNASISSDAEHYVVASGGLAFYLSRVSYTVTTRLLLGIFSMCCANFAYGFWALACASIAVLLVCSALARLFRTNLLLAKIEAIERSPEKRAEAERKFRQALEDGP